MLAIEYEMENLRATAWSNIVAYGSTRTIRGSDNLALSHLNSGGGTVTLDYEPAGDTNAPSRRVTVTLIWTGHDGSTRTNISMSMISKHGFLR
jgi:hypothetical protein